MPEEIHLETSEPLRTRVPKGTYLQLAKKLIEPESSYISGLTKPEAQAVLKALKTLNHNGIVTWRNPGTATVDRDLRDYIVWINR